MEVMVRKAICQRFQCFWLVIDQKCQLQHITWPLTRVWSRAFADQKALTTSDSYGARAEKTRRAGMVRTNKKKNRHAYHKQDFNGNYVHNTLEWFPNGGAVRAATSSWWLKVVLKYSVVKPNQSLKNHSKQGVWDTKIHRNNRWPSTVYNRS